MIGIFGGTFDPIHNGHVSVIENFQDLIGFDELIVLPNGNPPHKEKSTHGKDKFEMVKLALDNFQDLKIDNREIIDATVNGDCHIFPKIPLEEVVESGSYEALASKKIVTPPDSSR